MRFSCLLLIAFTAIGCAGRESIIMKEKPDLISMEGRIVVTDFGAKADGRFDCTSAFQSSLNAVSENGGGTVEIPVGMFRVAGHLEIPSGVTLQGQWTVPHHSRLPEDVTGTVLLVEEGEGSEDGPPFIMLNENSAVRGITLFYPNQTTDEIVPYPWAIRGKDMHCTVENVTFVNAYNGIDFHTHWNELHHIRNVYGLCLRRGVWVDNCTDIGRIENVHFNPHYWARARWCKPPDWEKIKEFMIENGEAFIFGRTDWEYVLNTFCYGYGIGYHFISGEQGTMNGNFVGIGSDGSNVCVQVDAANPFGILITNGEFVSMFGDHPVQIVTNPGFTGVLQLNNCAFWGPTYSCAELQGPGHVSFQQCNFVHWNAETAAISADNGTLSVVNSRFNQPHPHISLGEQLQGGVIMGNHFKGEMKISDGTEGKVETGLNVAY